MLTGEEVFYAHYLKCCVCHADGPELCVVGEMMVQFAGLERWRYYMRQAEQSGSVAK